MLSQILLYITIFLTISCAQTGQKAQISSDMLVRISEIEVSPSDINAYLQILEKEALASIKLEPGVISIFPMTIKDRPNSIRILEIYADKKSYESHLQSPHFKEYKSSTLKIVKSLKLIDMSAVDSSSMPLIFKKLKAQD